MPVPAVRRGRESGRPERAPIGYVLKVFPRVSETFVINEIRTLESLGEQIVVFSLHHNPEGPVHHGILAELQSHVLYVEDVLPAQEEVPAARRQLARALVVPKGDRARLLPRKYVRLALALARMARAEGVACLHAHFASRAAHVAALAALLSDLPYSMTAHAKDIYHRDVDADILRWKIEQARFVVTVTEYNRRHLERLARGSRAARGKIVRIYNGVDLSRFHSQEEGKDSLPLLVSVGRLVEKKGFPLLIDACRILSEQGRSFRCEIIGSGALAQALQQQISHLGLADCVMLAGARTTEEVAEQLRQARLIVLPCIVAADGNVDALPTVLLEAMATAKPLVSTRLSGIPEIVEDGDNGVLVPTGDTEALAGALQRLIDQPDLARSMGQAGRRRAERLFDLHTNVARLRSLLRGQQTVEAGL